MSRFFACPYLGADVELTEERERHIRQRHADMRPMLVEDVGAALTDPDVVAEQEYDGTTLALIRVDPEVAFPFLVVVVAEEALPDGTIRYWIVTAYRAVALSEWLVLWEKT